MQALGLCVLAFIAAWWATRRSVGLGLVAVAATGYFYGILRANFLTTASHFIFDASLAGLYIAYWPKFFESRDGQRTYTLRLWTVLLIAWPCLICILPFQPLMVSLVGLRGNIFFLPMLIIGGRIRTEDMRKFTLGLAVLNLLALGVGIAEYVLGIEPFFPRSAVTAIMYASGDVAGGFYRIPSLFTSAHAYAGSMVGTFPFLFGAWAQKNESSKRKLILLLGMIAALVGVLMASTRTFFAVALLFITVALLSSNLGGKKRLIWGAAIVVVGIIAMSNERFQRFKTLEDSDLVMERIAGSVNKSFVEVLEEYPMGNGLGGGGTSMPYFLEGSIVRPVAIENEYGRILAEQGFIGLLLWIGFVLWCLTKRTAFAASPWLASRRLIWVWYLESFISAAIGLGLLTGIPTTFMFLLGVGWAVVAPAKEPLVRRRSVPELQGLVYAR